MGRMAREQGARYVFAGRSDARRTHDEGEGGGAALTKVCPRCGEELFADMDVCYGCLYDFAKNEGRAGVRTTAVIPAPRERGADFVLRGDPLATIELDEVDDEPDGTEGGDGVVDREDGEPEPREDAPQPAVPPRHSRGSSPDDTIDLANATQGPPAVVMAATDASAEPVRMCLLTKDVELTLPLPPGGLAVGRGEDNDVVLRSRLVSRHHVRIACEGNEVVVRDCGATNPALVGGVALKDSARLLPGQEVMICDVTLMRAPVDD